MPAKKTTETVVLADTAADASVTDAETGEVVTGDEARKLISKALDGPPTPAPLRALAEKLPEKDEVQKAYKDAMLADSPQAEVEAKAVIVNASPNADETPSGKALLAVEGESDPLEAGEKYAQVKSAVRWGTANVEVK